MVIVTKFQCALSNYQTCFGQLVFLRPATCPKCGAQQSFIGHGFYQRKALDARQVYLIRVKRWYCTVCRRTLSLLPSFLLRFRQYGLAVIEAVVAAHYEALASWAEIRRRYAPAGAPSFRTIKRWCNAFAAHAAEWLAEVERTLEQPVSPGPIPLSDTASVRNVPQALLKACWHLLAWAHDQMALTQSYGADDRLRYLWLWGYARGLARLL